MPSYKYALTALTHNKQLTTLLGSTKKLTVKRSGTVALPVYTIAGAASSGKVVKAVANVACGAAYLHGEREKERGKRGKRGGGRGGAGGLLAACVCFFGAGGWVGEGVRAHALLHAKQTRRSTTMTPRCRCAPRPNTARAKRHRQSPAAAEPVWLCPLGRAR